MKITTGRASSKLTGRASESSQHSNLLRALLAADVSVRQP
jgi:hypothetical protein